MVDGTKVRLPGYQGANLGQGEMRWALASLGENKPLKPVGCWSNQSWKEIKKDLDNRLDYRRLEILFSDGEPGIEETLLEEGMLHQRYLLAGKRDLVFGRIEMQHSGS